MQIDDRGQEAINFCKKKYEEIFYTSQVILILSAAFSIEKEEMASSLPTLFKGTARS